MICEICQKNEATIHIDESFDKAFVCERHLCKHCAGKIDLFGENELFSINVDNIFNVYENDRILEKRFSNNNISMNSTEHLKCEKCHTTLKDFLKNKQVGCPSCYAVFASNVVLYLKITMNARRHLGKKPNHDVEFIIKNQKKFELERQLVDLISNEDYENAALVRDYISILNN